MQLQQHTNIRSRYIIIRRTGETSCLYSEYLTQHLSSCVTLVLYTIPMLSYATACRARNKQCEFLLAKWFQRSQSKNTTANGRTVFSISQSEGLRLPLERAWGGGTSLLSLCMKWTTITHGLIYLKTKNKYYRNNPTAKEHAACITS